MKTSLLTLMLVGLLTWPTLAQTTWTGTTSIDWNTAANWNPAGVPTATTDVAIPTASTPPRIGAGTAAVAHSVHVQSGAVLTIGNSASLTINGSKSFNGGPTAFYNQGTVNNSGQLVIGNLAPVGESGLFNNGRFTNNTGGQIQIDRSTLNGLFNGGTFTNAASITIGGIEAVGVYGLYNEAATFSNNTGGQIQIDRSTNAGLFSTGRSSFTNAAALTIGGTAPVGTYGIVNENSRFSNNTGGTVQIDRSTTAGLSNAYGRSDGSNVGIFTNSASITIGGIEAVGTYGLENNDSRFSNNTGGTIQIDRSTTAGLFNTRRATFTNAAALTIGKTAGVGDYGLYNLASFSNDAGGHIQIDNAGSTGLYNLRGIFTNAASIVIGAAASVGSYGLRNQGPFSNNTGGTIRIDRSSDTGLANDTGPFTNAASIVIGATASVGQYGLRNDDSFSNNTGGTIQIDRSGDRGLYNFRGIFTNAASLIIGATASVGRYGLILNAGTRFTNNTGGQIQIDRSTLNGLFNGGTFTNAASITIGRGAPVGQLGLYNLSYVNNNVATFNNNTCASLSLFAPFNNSSILTNDGLLTVSTTQAHTNTGFTNTGVIVYPQGSPIPNVTNNGVIALPLTTCGPTATPALQIGNGNRFTVGTTWYKESGLSTPVGSYSPNTFTATSPAVGGTYLVFFSLTDPANACSRTISIPLTVSPVAIISSGSATLTCASPTTILTASGGDTGETFSYRWDDNSTNAQRTVSVAGTYSVTVTGGNGCSNTASVVITDQRVNCNPPTTAPFSITGVTTVSCGTVTAGQRTLVFTPRYAGLSGQPISFSVTNELLPTTQAGPYTLRLYIDNPTITLKATQTGTPAEASFSYNWLAACNGGIPPSPTNQAPTTTGIANQNGTAGQGFSLNVAASFADPNGDALSYQVSGLPAGLSLSGSTISGTPSVSGVSNVTVMATDPSSLSVSTSFILTVNPAGIMPPSGFAITGVTTVSCETVNLERGERRLTFTPRYGGLNGQPVTFRVSNESLPTTAPGPYTLRVYTDNPTITLKATQTGIPAEVSFSYNWLAACTGARLGAEPVSLLDVRVLGNPAQARQVWVEVRGAAGEPLHLTLTDTGGQMVGLYQLEAAGPVERHTFAVSRRSAGLLLRVSTPTQSRTLRVLTAD